MTSLLDIIVATMLGGVLIIIMLNANGIVGETLSTYHGNLIVQQMLVHTIPIVESEFRNMGFGVAQGNQIVLQANDSSITFRYSLNRQILAVDNIQYRLGPSGEVNGDNRLCRFLYRRVNNNPAQPIGVVTQFRLLYMTRVGDTLSAPVTAGDLSRIYTVEISMEVQNPYALALGEKQGGGGLTGLYSSSMWRQTRIASQNFRR